MTNEELKKILENHQHWLNEDVDGWREMRADFTGADLKGAHLVRANLSGANLSGANLENANLEEANLEEANLVRANLSGAHLSGANLRDVNLVRANLSGAHLVRANLEITNLEEANLENADLRGANLEDAHLVNARLKNAYLVVAYLRNADFRGANLEGVEIKGAYLRGADLRRAENVPFIPMICPEEGAFIGWKKAIRTDGDLCIIKLYIPEDAKRSSATGRKCRCNKAKVLSIEGITSGLPFETAFSICNKSFIYKVGEYVEVDNFDEDRFNECAPGIHFFINKQEAIDY